MEKLKYEILEVCVSGFLFIYLALKAYAPYCVVIYGLSDSTVCLTLSHNRHDFRGEKKAIAHKTYVLIFCTNLSETFLIPRRIQGDTVVNVHRSSPKLPIIVLRF